MILSENGFADTVESESTRHLKTVQHRNPREEIDASVLLSQVKYERSILRLKYRTYTSGEEFKLLVYNF